MKKISLEYPLAAVLHAVVGVCAPVPMRLNDQIISDLVTLSLLKHDMAVTIILSCRLVSLTQEVHRIKSESHFVDRSLYTSVFEAAEVGHGIP